MEHSDEFQCKIDRMARIRRQQEALKTEWLELEGFFLERCAEDLADTKRKSVSYLSTSGRLTATMAESVKVTYPTYLKRIFGDAYKDAVTEDTKYKLSAPAARMLGGLWTNSYTEMTVAEVLAQLPTDDGTRKALAKKLKGVSYDTDKKALMAIGGFDETSAEQYAYFISEAAIWESFQRLMKVNQKEDAAAMAEVLDLIGGAVVVEETPKITLELLEV